MSVGRSEPIFNIPRTILALLAAMTAIQAFEVWITPDHALDVVARYAFVPLRLTNVFAPDRVAAAIAAWSASADAEIGRRAAVAPFFLQQGMPALFTVVTYAFLHGGWVHLGLNGLWLLAFGTPVARRFGAVRFLVFMAVAAVAGALAHWLCFPLGVEPVVGASAAVSGCMGAAIRFAFRPAFHAGPAGSMIATPPLTIPEIVRDRRALSFAIVWFASNALFGAGSMTFGLTDAPVAWQAHVGGFLAGVVLFGLFDRPQPVPHRASPDQGQGIEPEPPSILSE